MNLPDGLADEYWQMRERYGSSARLGEFMDFLYDFVGFRLEMALFASGCSKLRPGWAFPASGWMQPASGYA